jgi:hypothetical protein
MKIFNAKELAKVEKIGAKGYTRRKMKNLQTFE